MLVLRNGKKVVATYSGADVWENVLNDAANLERIAGAENVQRVRRAIDFNMFQLCIYGARLCFGRGWVLENRRDA